MPNELATAAATPGLPVALLAIAPAPVAPGAEPSDFAAVIGEIAGAPLLLDAPPAPPTGTDLPPVRPELAGPPEPLPPTDVADVMVGCGWAPEMAPGKFQSRVKDVPASLPPVPTDAEADEVQATVPGSRPWVLHTSSIIALTRALPRTQAPRAALPDCELPVMQPDRPEETKDEPAIAAPLVAITPPAHLPPVIVVPSASANLSPLPRQEAAEAVASEAAPVIVGAAPNPVQAKPEWHRPPAPAPTVEPSTEAIAAEQPRQVTPDPLATIAPRLAETTPIRPAPPRPDTALPPELARQVAQLIQPKAEEAAAPIVAPVEPTLPITPTAAPAQTAAPVQAPAATQQHHAAPVDFGRSEWMQAMIDRISDIAQADGRREAQIRLLPDALGAVDVKIVQRDERMHVTVSSDNAQVRQLFADAAPRLQELAEARGLRFAQTDIGGGQPHDRRQAPEQQSQTPLRPRSAQSEQDVSTHPDGDLIA
ncbi:hypothetical protein HJG53_08455 [Sphingomonas sp. ID1715]|uniref:flagellar hook-length control protein FliK n=1 Tax=Sphingomonas sp. ID1715 TaxID=1656898 RepID=UPI0014889C0A|nr:flagellar hook-length control protein FliK [Sphingomonas sp. ID1715]NNM76929.1 hypothetical protein [Sphingomonas sp. ID1715]